MYYVDFGVYVVRWVVEKKWIPYGNHFEIPASGSYVLSFVPYQPSVSRCVPQIIYK